MKRILLITGLVAMMMMPAVLPAAEDPLKGAVEFGSEENSELVWKSGRIQRIDEEGMVVSDIWYCFTDETKYYSASGRSLSWMNFFPRTTVKFVLKKDLRTVVSLIKQ